MFTDESAWPFVRTPLARSVVKDALEKLPAERNCYQLIGGTLVPKTVEGVLPQVSATLTNVSPAAVGTPRLPMGCSRARLQPCGLPLPRMSASLASPTVCAAQLTSVVAGLREELEKAAAARGAFESKHRIKPSGSPAAAAPAASSGAATPGVLA